MAGQRNLLIRVGGRLFRRHLLVATEQGVERSDQRVRHTERALLAQAANVLSFEPAERGGWLADNTDGTAVAVSSVAHKLAAKASRLHFTDDRSAT